MSTDTGFDRENYDMVVVPESLIKQLKQHVWYDVQGMWDGQKMSWRVTRSEMQGIMVVCLSCGVNLGNIEYDSTKSHFSPLEFMTLCNKCFTEKIGKPISADKIQTPYNPHPK